MVVNLTPHAVRIVDKTTGVVTKEFASEGLARATSTSHEVGQIEGISIVEQTFGEVYGLPEYAEDTYYIVSLVTAQAAKAAGRRTDDLLLTSSPVRNAEGQIIGCECLARI